MVKNSKILLWLVVAGSLALFRAAKPAAQAEQKEAAANIDLADILSGLSSEKGPWKNMSDIIQGYEPVGWQSFEGESKVLVDGAIKTFASSPDGRYLAYVLGDVIENVIYVRDLQDLDKVPVILRGYRGGHLSFSPDSRVIVSDAGWGNIKIWDILESTSNHYTGINKFFFSPDNRYVVGGASDQIFVYDIINKKPYTHTFQNLPPFDDVKCSLNLIAIHADSSILVMNMPKSFNEAPSERTRFPARNLRSMAFSADGRYLAISSHSDGFMVWDMQKDSIIPTLRHRHNSEDYIARDLAFSPTGDCLFASTKLDEVNVWNMRSLNVKAVKIESEFSEDVAFYKPSMTLESRSSIIGFSPNGHDIALVQDLNTLKVGNIQDINVKSTALKSPFAIDRFTRLFFSSGGRYFAAKEPYYPGSSDKNLAIWDTYNFAQMPIKFNGSIRRVVFSPDDRSMALVTLAGITLYNIDAMHDRIANEQREAKEQQERTEQRLQRFKERATQRSSGQTNMLLERSNQGLLDRLFPKQVPQQKQERASKRPVAFAVVQQQKERQRLEAGRIREQDGQ